MSEEEEVWTLDQQFIAFAKLWESKDRDGKTMDLQRADYWMRQAAILNDRAVTMTDTGILFFKYNKSEISFEEFEEYVKDLADSKEMCLEDVTSALCNCGPPGTRHVQVPKYGDYFLTWKSKKTLVNVATPSDEEISKARKQAKEVQGVATKQITNKYVL